MLIFKKCTSFRCTRSIVHQVVTQYVQVSKHRLKNRNDQELKRYWCNKVLDLTRPDFRKFYHLPQFWCQLKTNLVHKPSEFFSWFLLHNPPDQDPRPYMPWIRKQIASYSPNISTLSGFIRYISQTLLCILNHYSISFTINQTRWQYIPIWISLEIRHREFYFHDILIKNNGHLIKCPWVAIFESSPEGDHQKKVIYLDRCLVFSFREPF